MKNILLFTAFSLLITSCASNQTGNNLQDSLSDTAAVEEIRNLCFQRLEGQSNQDTSTLLLEINGDLVKGVFNHVPYEKDSRRGTFTGTKQDNIIRGIWAYMQEGMNDTLSMEFKLQDDILLQKTLGVNKNNGRQQLSDTSTFSIPYRRIQCDNENR